VYVAIYLVVSVLVSTVYAVWQSSAKGMALADVQTKTVNNVFALTVISIVITFWIYLIIFSIRKKYIGTITYKTLSSALKELERDGLVDRKEYPQIPPKVEYRLTERGQSLIPILDALCEWGDVHRVDTIK
jgi:DNA-binding HxlR family transcriptional regulator